MPPPSRIPSQAMLFPLFLQTPEYPRDIPNAIFSVRFPQTVDAMFHLPCWEHNLFPTFLENGSSLTELESNAARLLHRSVHLIFCVPLSSALLLQAYYHKIFQNLKLSFVPLPDWRCHKALIQNQLHRHQLRTQNNESACPLSCWEFCHCERGRMPCYFCVSSIHTLPQPVWL